MSHLKIFDVEQTYLSSAIILIFLEAGLTLKGVFQLSLTSCAGTSPQKLDLKSNQDKYIIFPSYHLRTGYEVLAADFDPTGSGNSATGTGQLFSVSALSSYFTLLK